MPNYSTQIDSAVAALQRPAGVVVVPTDTTYGLICRLNDSAAVDRIYEMKGRDRSKPLIILGAQTSDLLPWMDGDPRLAMLLANKFWPGPLTIVARASSAVPRGILSGGTTVGLRLPDHQSVRQVLDRLPDGSAASTSANLSGAGSPTKLDEVFNSVGNLVDYVMSDCDKKPAGTESTIIDISKNPPVVLRAGALSPQLLTQCLQEYE